VTISPDTLRRVDDPQDVCCINNAKRAFSEEDFAAGHALNRGT